MLGIMSSYVAVAQEIETEVRQWRAIANQIRKCCSVRSL